MHTMKYFKKQRWGAYVNSYFELLKEIVFLIFVICALIYYDFVSTVLISSFNNIILYILLTLSKKNKKLE